MGHQGTMQASRSFNALVLAFVFSSFGIFPGSALGRPSTLSEAGTAQQVSVEQASVPTRTIISWLPKVITSTLSPGEQKIVSVAFTPSKNIRRASIVISPELAPFIATNPSSFEHLRKGKQETLTISVVPALNITFGTVTGNIQLLKGQGLDADPDEDDLPEVRPLLDPLSVAINIWPKSILPNSDIQADYPPLLVPVSANHNLQAIGFYESRADYLDALPPVFHITVDHLLPGTSLLDWVRSMGVADSAISVVTVGSRQFTRWTDSIDLDSDLKLTSFSILIDSSRVVTVTTANTTFAASGDFIQIVSSVGTR